MEGGFALGRREGDLIRRLLGPISLLCNRLADMCVKCVCEGDNWQGTNRETSKQVKKKHR